tara:strand:+ start:69 stop:665 length:597 start_codon:yes stop_codon:yes gene_type:complete
MKITKAQLKQIIAEELQQELYMPFIGGGALEADYYSGLEKTAQSLLQRLEKYSDGSVNDEISDVDVSLDGALKQLKGLTKRRHKKKELTQAYEKYSQAMDIGFKLGDELGADYRDIQREKERIAREIAQEEKASDARRLRADREAGDNTRRHAKDAKERAGKDNFMSNRLSRARQNKADRESLEEIIRQELAKISKGN